MKHYAGLDVSMKSTAICIVDEQGKIVYETTAKTEPHILADVIEKTGLKIELVGFESGSLSHYLMKGFRERVMNAVCIDARKMSTLLSIKVNKTDKHYARGIAAALRAGMFTRMQEKPQEETKLVAFLARERT